MGKFKNSCGSLLWLSFLRNCTHSECRQNFVISADTWPEVFDDNQARQDWGWEHKYDLDQLVDVMITNLKRIYNKN